MGGSIYIVIAIKLTFVLWKTQAKKLGSTWRGLQNFVTHFDISGLCQQVLVTLFVGSFCLEKDLVGVISLPC